MKLVDVSSPLVPVFQQVISLLVKYLYCFFFIGIVRSVSAVEHALFIATPVAPSALQKVNCLQLGAIGLPTRLLTSDEVCVRPLLNKLS